jgi:hypothetical protein
MRPTERTKKAPTAGAQSATAGTAYMMWKVEAARRVVMVGRTGERAAADAGAPSRAPSACEDARLRELPPAQAFGENRGAAEDIAEPRVIDL